MTQEEFIKKLKREDYSYKIKGDKIIVTHKGVVDLEVTSLPPGVEFRNRGVVYLGSLTSLPPGVKFNNDEYFNEVDVFLDALTSISPGVVFSNSGNVYLRSLTSLPPGVVFENGGRVDLRALTSISPGVVFSNGGVVSLDRLTSLPPGVEFNNKNKKGVFLGDLIGGYFKGWEGNIEGIDPKRLLSFMISKGYLKDD
jgi:hypothetical protein